MKKLLPAALASLVVLAMSAGCTKAIMVTPQAQNVKLVTAAQKKNCEFIKTISTRQLIGPDKTGDALKLALNDAGAADANAFYVIESKNEGGIKGGVVTGEALRCKR